jgi:hypothetical protein
MASRAHGVVTRAELLCAGITAKEVRQRLEVGALIAVFPGVYRVGHTAPSSEAHYLAAVLACGEGALLSGRAAAHLWGLLKGPAPAPEVTAPTERRVKGVETHRARRAKRGTTTWRGIPVTTPPEPWSTWLVSQTKRSWPAPATKRASATAPPQSRSRPFWRAARMRRGRGGWERCCAGTCT